MGAAVHNLANLRVLEEELSKRVRHLFLIKCKRVDEERLVGDHAIFPLHLPGQLDQTDQAIVGVILTVFDVDSDEARLAEA